MNLSDLQAKLISVARRDTPSEDTPYAFEKRIMNRLAERPQMGVWALWSGPLWRAAMCCMAVTVLCGAWSYSASRAEEPALPAGDLSQDLAAAVFAPMNQPADTSW